MAGLSIQVRTKGLDNIFADVRKRVAKPLVGRARPGVVKALKAGPLRDLRRGGHHGPTGGFSPWRKTKPFGDCPPAAQILGGESGGIGSAWRSARVVPSARSITIVARHPGMRAHAFGAKIRVTRKMRGFLGAVCDVHLKASTKSITIPRRRFGDKTPQMAQEIAEAVAEAIRGR